MDMFKSPTRVASGVMIVATDAAAVYAAFSEGYPVVPIIASAAELKVALTFLASDMETVQVVAVPKLLQSPPHPAKVERLPGVSVKITVSVEL